MQQNGKPIPLDQLRAWDILGESPVLYAYEDAPHSWTPSWLYKWQLKGGVVYHTSAGESKHTRKSSASSLVTCIAYKILYLNEKE